MNDIFIWWWHNNPDECTIGWYPYSSFNIQMIHIKGIYTLLISIYIKGNCALTFRIYVQVNYAPTFRIYAQGN